MENTNDLNKTESMGLFTIKDEVADDYAPVFQAINENVAIRQYEQLMEKAYNPADFSLWLVGTIDKEQRITPNKKLVLKIQEVSK